MVPGTTKMRGNTRVKFNHLKVRRFSVSVDAARSGKLKPCARAFCIQNFRINVSCASTCGGAWLKEFAQEEKIRSQLFLFIDKYTLMDGHGIVSKNAPINLAKEFCK